MHKVFFSSEFWLLHLRFLTLNTKKNDLFTELLHFQHYCDFFPSKFCIFESQFQIFMNTEILSLSQNFDLIADFFFKRILLFFRILTLTLGKCLSPLGILEKFFGILYIRTDIFIGILTQNSKSWKKFNVKIHRSKWLKSEKQVRIMSKKSLLISLFHNKLPSSHSD